MWNPLRTKNRSTAKDVVARMVKTGELPPDMAEEATVTLQVELRRALRRCLRDMATTSASLVVGTRMAGA